jgi:tRNA threonylcarbamoyladenosine biosynthesis protein TsaE
MGEVAFITESPEQTLALGCGLAALLKKNDVIALYGELGSGKTVFTKGLCKGLGVNELVTSPTFTLIQEYRGHFPVFHFDFYRLSGPDEAEMLDLDEYFNRDGISIIEWADVADSLLPAYCLQVKLDRIESRFPNQRCIQIAGPDGLDLEQLRL